MAIRNAQIEQQTTKILEMHRKEFIQYNTRFYDNINQEEKTI